MKSIVLAILMLVSLNVKAEVNNWQEVKEPTNKFRFWHSCNDRKDSCQNSIIREIEISKRSLFIINYDFSNEEINQAITRAAIKELNIWIMVPNKYILPSYIIYLIKTYNVKFIVDNNNDLESNQTFVFDRLLTIKGKIDSVLKTDIDNCEIRNINCNPKFPEAIEFLRGSVLADITLNKFIYHNSHGAELKVNN